MHSDIWVKKEVQYDNEAGDSWPCDFVIFRHAVMFLSQMKNVDG